MLYTDFVNKVQETYTDIYVSPRREACDIYSTDSRYVKASTSRSGYLTVDFMTKTGEKLVDYERKTYNTYTDVDSALKSIADYFADGTVPVDEFKVEHPARRRRRR